MKKVAKEKRKGYNMLIILDAWILWKHHNTCAFDKARTCLDELLRSFGVNIIFIWGLAGARKLLSLSIGRAHGVV